MFRSQAGCFLVSWCLPSILCWWLWEKEIQAQRSLLSFPLVACLVASWG